MDSESTLSQAPGKMCALQMDQLPHIGSLASVVAHRKGTTLHCTVPPGPDLPSDGLKGAEAQALMVSKSSFQTVLSKVNIRHWHLSLPNLSGISRAPVPIPSKILTAFLQMEYLSIFLDTDGICFDNAAALPLGEVKSATDSNSFRNAVDIQEIPDMRCTISPEVSYQ
ncbi:hypothetical protein UY3_05309 [Chelonia mydas]|uniref:Uncharacterized protein n=1 Tax=Chelonia mydas TaxID=8469 RepID=M7BHW4_CHEMY|nr:hypothetical protein UY3_05309 [Chelonia mydas]